MAGTLSLPFKPEFLLEISLGISKTGITRQLLRYESSLLRKSDEKACVSNAANKKQNFFFNCCMHCNLKMYGQIRIDPSHAPYQRLIFRSLADEPQMEYELQTESKSLSSSVL